MFVSARSAHSPSRARAVERLERGARVVCVPVQRPWQKRKPGSSAARGDECSACARARGASLRRPARRSSCSSLTIASKLAGARSSSCWKWNIAASHSDFCSIKSARIIDASRFVPSMRISAMHSSCAASSSPRDSCSRASARMAFSCASLCFSASLYAPAACSASRCCSWQSASWYATSAAASRCAPSWSGASTRTREITDACVARARASAATASCSAPRSLCTRASKTSERTSWHMSSSDLSAAPSRWSSSCESSACAGRTS